MVITASRSSSAFYSLAAIQRLNRSIDMMFSLPSRLRTVIAYRDDK